MRSADVGDRGYVTPAFVGVVGLTMVLLVMVANLYVAHYARGVLQAAVEEGARQALAVGDPQACRARVEDVVRSGLGTMAADVGPPSCTLTPGGATATVQATFRAWLPGVPVQPTAVTARVHSGTGR